MVKSLDFFQSYNKFFNSEILFCFAQILFNVARLFSAP